MKHIHSLPGLTSIIVPCWNQLEFTRQCIAALKRHTRPEWELIAVDNGSTDGSGSYLAGVRDLAAVPVTLVCNATNLGFPAAINQGLQLARGEYLVLLNNDVVVTDGWLDQMIALASAKTDITAEHAKHAERKAERGNGIDRDELIELAERHSVKIVDLGAGGEQAPVDNGNGHGEENGVASSLRRAGGPPPAARTIGLVGPMSNYAAPPQLVESVTYRDLAEMPSFARRWRDEHRGQWFTVPKLSGFCLLMKRAVYEKIGGLDERFGLGLFDDDDLAERAWRAGFELAVAHDLFVHHYGSRTFAGNGIDAGKLLDENARRFADKWGLRETGGGRVSLRPWKATPESHAKSGQSQNGVGEEDLTQSRQAAKNANGMMPETRSELQDRSRIDQRALGQTSSERSVPSSFASSRLCVKSSSSDHSTGVSDLADRARVSLTMIVKDEENNLPICLESVRGVFDEIIIVDTGSRDRTIEIALSFGAKVFEFAWVDSFSAARNEALSHATGDYAFWLDADDVVEPDEREKLRALLGSLKRLAPSTDVANADERGEGRPDGSSGVRELAPAVNSDDSGVRPPHSKEGCADAPCEGVMPTHSTQSEAPAARPEPRPPGDLPHASHAIPAAYVVRCACDPSPDGTGGNTVVDHIRLFPLRGDVRWTYRVHEQILPALNQAKIPVRRTNLTIRHTGYVDSALRARKLERDVRLLRLDLQDYPDEPFILFNLGAIGVERRQWHEAIGFLERSLARSAPTDSIVRKLFALIARSHQMLGDSQEALRACTRGLELDPEDAELWFRRAVVHRHRGESAAAEQSWRRVLNLRRPNKFCSFDQGIYGHLTRRNLAALAAERGDHAEVERLWNEVLAECPGDREALARLGRARDRQPAANG